MFCSCSRLLLKRYRLAVDYKYSVFNFSISLITPLSINKNNKNKNKNKNMKYKMEEQSIYNLLQADIALVIIGCMNKTSLRLICSSRIWDHEGSLGVKIIHLNVNYIWYDDTVQLIPKYFTDQPTTYSLVIFC
jgi:hypothetical protein